MKSLTTLLFALALFPSATFAAVTINSVTLTPNPVEEGSSVNVEIEVQRSGSGCTNNWGSTDIVLNGATSTFSYGPLDFTQGSGVSTSTHSVQAPNVAGDYDLTVIVYRGNEVNPNNCDTSIVEDTATETLEVEAIPAPSAPAAVSYGGGGGMCHPNTGYPECQSAAHFRFHGLTPSFGAVNMDVLFQKLALLQKAISLLEQIKMLQ